MSWTEDVNVYLATPDFSDATRIRYRTGLDEFHHWYTQTYAEEPDPKLLTDEEMREWRGHLSDVQQLSAATVNLRLSAVKGLARFRGNRLAVKAIRKVEKPIEVLTARELGRLNKAAEGHRWLDRRNVALLAIMARAGLRVGEVVTLDLGSVTIRERSGQVIVRRGKGRKERTVRLSKEARRELSAYLERRPEWAGTEDDAPLFVSKTGLRLQSRAVERMVHSAALRAEITNKEVTPHVLRHTFATRFLEQQRRRGQSVAAALVALRDILGHANLATTSRYLHANAEQVQEMIEDL